MERVDRGRRRRRHADQRSDGDQTIAFSKALSYILRHGAVREGVAMRPDGFVRLCDLLKHRKFQGKKLMDFQELVDKCEKKRFLMRSEVADTGELVWLIKANQGHSLEAVS